VGALRGVGDDLAGPAGALGGGLLEVDVPGQLAGDAGDALDLAPGGEALVEAVGAEVSPEVGPGREALFPALDAAVRLAVDPGQVGADAEHGLEGDGLGDHERGVAPALVPDALGRLEEVADLAVEGVDGGLGAGAGDVLPVGAEPAHQLVEQLGLQHPFLLLAAAAEAVDLVPEGAVGVGVEALDDAGGELLVRGAPRDPLVEIDEVALVDAGGGRVDGDEHLGGEVLALAVEDDARHVDGAGVVGVLAAVEIEGGEAVLAVDDQVFPPGFLEVADVVELPHRVERERLCGEQQDGAGDGRLGHGRLVEVADGGDLLPRDVALERGVGALDARDEPADLVVVLDLVSGDLVAVAVEAADEAHLLEEVLGGVRDEVKHAVFLADLCA
jgi:hypothetical protein